MERRGHRLVVAGQRPSTVNAIGLMVDGRSSTLSRHRRRSKAVIELELDDERS
jgi:hypothetical protein